MASERAYPTRFSSLRLLAAAVAVAALAIRAQPPRVVEVDLAGAASPPLVHATPRAGVYTTPPTVTLTASEPSTIYYTGDGTDPTTSPTRASYRAPLPIIGSTLLTFVAITADNRRSSVMSEVYTIATTAGYRDMSYSGASAPTSKDAESELWYADGAWWGVFYNPVAPKGWRVYRLDTATQFWSSVSPDGTPLSPDLGAAVNLKWDALADGGALYVASHIQQGPNQQDYSSSSAASGSVRFWRLRYHPTSRTYSVDFSRSIAPGNMETFVLAKDTTGTLWGAFTQDNLVKVMHTQGGDSDWTAPYPLPTAGSAVSSDDTAAIVSFGGKVGVMWSNQCPDFSGCPPDANENRMYFAWHVDGAADTDWTVEDAYFVPGAKGADDHINLKADSAGRVYAAVKTSFTKPTDPLTNLLVRQVDGMWDAYPFGTVADDHTRAIVLIDERDGFVFMFAASPAGGGAIYVKQSPLADIAFAPGLGTPIIQSADDSRLNNVTSTKQTVDSRSGMVVVAGDDTTHRYLHNWIDPAAFAAPPAGAANGTATATAELAACADGPLYPVGADVVTTREAPFYAADQLSATPAASEALEETKNPIGMSPEGSRLVIAGPYVEAGVCDLWPVRRPHGAGLALIDERALQPAPAAPATPADASG